MRVLIVCHHDPESNAIGAIRVRKFAENFATAGSSVKVLSKEGVSSYEGSVQSSDTSTIWSEAVGRRFCRMPQESSDQASWSTRLETILWRMVRPKFAWIFRHLIAVPDVEVFSLLKLFRRTSDLGGWVPEIVVASGPPFSVFYIARRIARQQSIPWVADYRDLWTLSSYYVLGPIRRRVDRVLERRLMKSAAFVTTVSQPLADEMNLAFGVRSEVVLNGYDPDDLAGFPLRPQPHLGLPLRIVYAGEIYEGKRDPEPLFNALASMRLDPCQLSVEFYGDTVHLVEDAARRYGVEDLVKCAPRLPHSESVALQQGADILLLLMWNNVGERGVYTGKLFEYLGARRPILMLGFPKGVAAELIRGRGAGVIANDPSAIASALYVWLAAKRDKGSVATLPEAVATGLTRREQSDRLRRLLRGQIEGSNTGMGS